MKSLDIAVAGCGPGGMAAAILLRRDGHHVTIFERFDIPRPIGSGLMIQPTGLAVLAALGLDRALIDRGARIDRLVGKTAPQGRTVLDVRYSALGRQNDFFGVGIHRAALFDLLYDAALSSGIMIETGRSIMASDLESDGRRRLLFDRGEASGRFDLIVDALGTRTTLAAKTGRDLSYGALWGTVNLPADAGFDDRALEQRYRRANIMAGVLPIGTTPVTSQAQAALFWSLKADRLAEWRRESIDAWKENVHAIWPATAPLLEQIGDADQLTFAHYAHRTLTAPAGRGIIHIGDAWHSASPQLGQGANMALLDGYALMLGLRHHADIADALGHAIGLRRYHVRLYQALTAILTPVYQSDSIAIPMIRDRVIGPLSKIWWVGRIQALLVSGLVGRPLKRLGLDG